MRLDFFFFSSRLRRYHIPTRIDHLPLFWPPLYRSPMHYVFFLSLRFEVRVSLCIRYNWCIGREEVYKTSRVIVFEPVTLIDPVGCLLLISFAV